MYYMCHVMYIIQAMTVRSPVNFFNQLIDEVVKLIILNETIRYAQQYIESNKEYIDRHPKARVYT